MLSRNADCIYWMSRHMERAENLARLLDALYQISLLPGTLDNESLSSPLSLSATQAQYTHLGAPLTIENILKFCTLNRQNQASLYNCLRQARDNAHVVRGIITSEMWESINTTWLQLQEMTHQHQSAQGYRRFLEWVKERSHLFRGVTFGTIRRNQAFGFSRIGTFIERSDNTLRILLIQANAAHDTAHSWEILLQSLAALESYREVYRNRITPRSVAELLLLNETFPRSLHASVLEINQTLALIEGPQGRECQRLCAALLANLRYGAIDSVLQSGLVPAILEFLDTITQFSLQIQSAYLEGNL